jgi:LysM repeat protein
MKLPKLPRFFAMKPRKKLQATATARRAQPIPDHYDEEEPHTRLSSAFVVVLILHVVAVGGIYAFNSIRSHRKVQDPPAQSSAVTSSTGNPAAAPSAPNPTVVRTENHGSTAAAPSPTTTLPATPSPTPAARTHRVVAGENLTKIAQQNNVTVAELEAANGAKNVATLRIGQLLTIPKPNPAARTEQPPKVAAATTKSSKTYVVAKGDSAVAIAKKLGVSSAELLRLNNIDDPKKLQIGQTLKVPVKKSN